MRKINLLLTLSTVFVFSFCGSKSQTKNDLDSNENTSQLNNNLPDKGQAYWEDLAEGMNRALIRHFWGANFEGHEDRYYFNYGSDMSNMTTNHYWPQAHAMDVVVDGYKRTSDQFYLDLYPLWWDGAPRYNFSGREEDAWWNEFVDDMEWIVLAQLRMYESTGEEQYFAKATQMYNDWIWTNWGPEDEAPWYGGITWKTDVEKTKNACSNGPGALVATRIYTLYDQVSTPGDKAKQAYLDEAVKIYSWLRNNLYEPSEGKVFDNMNREGKIDRAIYTYNQGTFIGAAHELYKITGESQYLEDAIQASNYVIDHMSRNNGVLPNSTSGDGGLFNGIFFRYFVNLVNEPDLDAVSHEKFHNYITKCATVMAENGVNKNNMLYGGDWWNAPADDAPVSLTPMLSGCMLAEAMCVLKPLN
ncbi:AGE family epimerase/isomerase [Algoriphagus sp. AGSA1]|uniref:glycoside hydrolase family 76 protein n=1 Tax=Algoriphagus sp. AGSA1 TaxID=2907213 RepID=UPI001F32B161|nr:glycoside hydrolase family 76 protein [Algoriphagus sp. AGSA1]MCE7058158.1 AGE family epimerase/isomerase [Algoriphagus sp. AGSA1]